MQGLRPRANGPSSMATMVAAFVAAVLLLAVGCGPSGSAGSGAASAPAGRSAAAPTAGAAPGGGSAAAPATASAAAPARAAWEQEWERVVAAARQEGKVVLGIPPGPQYEPAIREAFGKALPGIEVEMVNLHAAQFSARLARERAAGEYAWDAWIGGPDVDVYALGKEGAFDSLRDDLILPDVLDDAKWLGGLQGRFSDEGKRYMFNFGARNGEGGFVNRDFIPESELAKAEDLWKPQFRGKIIWQDPRQSGSGVNAAAVLLHVYGEQRLRELWSSQQIATSTDERQMAEWVARGRNPIGIGLVANRGLDLLRREGVGLNVKGYPHPIALAIPGGHGLVAVNRPPHPNARKVMINWLLSPEGQTVIGQAVQWNSARLDLPPFDPANAVPPGVETLNTQSEAFGPQRQKANEIARELLR
jgi:ABC-type Fe3+ transport system substrate-binding protein